MKNINKILVANRGEIAQRILRTCRDMNVASVAVYSEADARAPYLYLADEALCIGGPRSDQSYLSIESILEAARRTGADAIHPGYGFLSENPRFAQECSEAGITFIGPGSEAIASMGDKTRARQIIKEAGVPLPPGTTEAIDSIDEARRQADEIGFPVLIKAAAGGGGKGMRIVEDQEDFESALKASRSEAQNAFGDNRVYVEKYFRESRHVEFQIVGDNYGNVVHLFDRECSIQRRHQKIIEEAPCAVLDEALREKMGQAAIDVARACGYVNAGTVEFLLDKDHNFYFLEMNTRLQVEHPVTELITGVDLVEWQIRIADGEPVPLAQEHVDRRGHAIESRIYAEDPENNFLPSTGTLKRHRIPSGPGVRVDQGVEELSRITTYYDPMIAKLCTWGANRKQAIDRMRRAIFEYEITGVHTTLPFCDFVMQNSGFLAANYHTGFVDSQYSSEQAQNIAEASLNEDIHLLAALLKHSRQHSRSADSGISDGVERDHSESKIPVDNDSWWKRRRR